jgi:benzodiazapine receptor
MIPINKSKLSLIIWVVGLIAVGSIIGSLTKPEIRLLAEPIYVKKFEGGAEQKDAAYLEIRKDLSTVPTYKLQTEIGLCKKSISTWYSTLHRSPLTPPNYVFPIAWTILYGIIGACGFLIWRAPSSPELNIIKILYVNQLILNWSWTPLFFHYHLTGISLIVLGAMDILVSILIWLAYPKIREVSLLMIPYLLWILFATYLNFYIWWYN